MGKINNLKNQLFLIPQKNNHDKLVIFKFDTYEKKIFSKLSTKKRKHIIQTLLILFLQILNQSKMIIIVVFV